MVVNLEAVLGPRLTVTHPEQARATAEGSPGEPSGLGKGPRPGRGPATGAQGRPTPPRREPQEKLVPVQVFQHELAHLALARYTSPNTPGWVDEGAAMYLSGERRMPVWRALTPSQLDRLSLVDFSYLGMCPYYAYCNAAVLYLVETYGPKLFWDFYRSYKSSGPRLSSGFRIEQSPSEELLQRVYGFGLQELDERTRAWIRREVAADSKASI